MKLSGLYSLCIKYVDDDTYYMVPLIQKNGKKKQYTKCNLELIDEFTSKFKNVDALKKFLNDNGYKKEIEKVCIKYKNKKRVLETPLMIGDNVYRQIVSEYINSKYNDGENKTAINLDNTDVSRVIKDLFTYIKNDYIYQNYIYENPYFVRELNHLYEKILVFKELYDIDINHSSNEDYDNTKLRQSYCIVEKETIKSYTGFRKLYIWIESMRRIQRINTKKTMLADYKEKIAATNDSELYSLFEKLIEQDLSTIEIQKEVGKRTREKYGPLM